MYMYTIHTNFSALIILAIIANGIKTLILIPTNNYTQSRGYRISVSESQIK